MALFEFHITQHVDVDRLDNKLDHIIKNQKLIMKELDDLKVVVAEQKTEITKLKTAVDLEQEQIAKLLELNAEFAAAQQLKITELEAKIAEGATPEELTALAEEIKTHTTEIITTREDLAATIADEPEEPPVEPPVEPPAEEGFARPVR